MTKPISGYYDQQRIAEAIEQGRHRDWVGGLWDEIGRLQIDFLRQQGLRPDMRVLDLGCGCFRAGIHLVEFLDSGNYYGMDISQELIDAGYEREIKPLGLVGKLPTSNLLCDGEFRVERFGTRFDVGMAQSLFTHLPANHIKLCLARLAAVFAPGGLFYATAFVCGQDEDWSQPMMRANNKIRTYPTQDPFHYEPDDLRCLIDSSVWAFELIGDWGHPRGQAMLKFTRQDSGAAQR